MKRGLSLLGLGGRQQGSGVDDPLSRPADPENPSPGCALASCPVEPAAALGGDDSTAEPPTPVATDTPRGAPGADQGNDPADMPMPRKGWNLVRKNLAAAAQAARDATGRSGRKKKTDFERQMQIMSGKNKSGGRENIQMQADFKLEALSGKKIKLILYLYYFSIFVAFVAKMFSDKTMSVRNICGDAHDDAAMVDSNVLISESGACMASYKEGEGIPIVDVPGVPEVVCPASVCYKWLGVVEPTSVLIKGYRIAFIVEATGPDGAEVEDELWFGGWSHSLDRDGRALDQGELLPPSAFHRRNVSYNADPYTWLNRSGGEKIRFACKPERKCDAVVFPEPILAAATTRRLQLLLLNASVLETVLPEDLTPSLGIVFGSRTETVLELVVRYGALVWVLFFILEYVRTLGFSNFFSMRPHFRQHGAIHSKPWLTEQKFTVIILIFSIIYLNPGKIILMDYFHTHGATLDGPEFSWHDRTLTFIDVNLPHWFVGLFRAYMLIILACCFEKTPKLAVGRGTWARAWPYWTVFAWYALFILQDCLRIKLSYKNYYVNASTETVFRWSGDFASLSVMYAALLAAWLIMMLSFGIRARRSLRAQRYWPTKSRQLSFRFFVLLYVWHLVYVVASEFYCWWQLNHGRAIFEDIVCRSASTTVGEGVSTIIFVLVLTYGYGPVVFVPGAIPPEPLDADWLTTKWPRSWIDYVNARGNSTMYFFKWETERRLFRLTQDDVDPLPAAGHAPSLYDVALAKMRDVRGKMDKAQSRLKDMGTKGKSKIREQKEKLKTAASKQLQRLPTVRRSFGVRGGSAALSEPLLAADVETDDDDSFASDESSSISSLGEAHDSSRESVKPLFSLELAVDMMCISWEVYGDEPGEDHRQSTPMDMPIDVKRHGYELLEVIHACVDGRSVGMFDVKNPLHKHPLSYLYVRAFCCARCGMIAAGGGMCYECQSCAKRAQASKFSGYTKYALCRQCFSETMAEADELREEEERRAMTLGGSSTATGGGMGENQSFGVSGLGGDPADGDKSKMKTRLGERLGELQDAITRYTSQEDEIQSADLQALICIDDSKIVVAFRGTSCFTNVKTDAQFFRDVVQEMVDDPQFEQLGFTSWMSRLKRKSGLGLPRCHSGFIKAFEQIGPQVMKRLKPIIRVYSYHQVCCTGHSLGGALACLMAYWISRFLKRTPIVYTFGSPRMGNGTFAELYNRAVPTTFRVVNQSDVVSTIPIGFWGTIFKHVGQEVGIDRGGNLVIAPTFIEKFIGPTKRGNVSIKDHLMIKYAKSMSRVCQYFGVLDCTMVISEDRKLVQCRRRWDVNGRCSLCGVSPLVASTCRVSGALHHRPRSIGDLNIEMYMDTLRMHSEQGPTSPAHAAKKKQRWWHRMFGGTPASPAQGVGVGGGPNLAGIDHGGESSSDDDAALLMRGPSGASLRTVSPVRSSPPPSAPPAIPELPLAAARKLQPQQQQEDEREQHPHTHPDDPDSSLYTSSSCPDDPPPALRSAITSHPLSQSQSPTPFGYASPRTAPGSAATATAFGYALPASPTSPPASGRATPKATPRQVARRMSLHARRSGKWGGSGVHPRHGVDGLCRSDSAVSSDSDAYTSDSGPDAPPPMGLLSYASLSTRPDPHPHPHPLRPDGRLAGGAGSDGYGGGGTIGGGYDPGVPGGRLLGSPEECAVPVPMSAPTPSAAPSPAVGGGRLPAGRLLVQTSENAWRAPQGRVVEL